MNENQKNNPVIGVDFEGTVVRAGLVKNNQIKIFHNTKISGRESEKYILDKLVGVIKKVYSKDLSGIGIGVPSQVDVKEGIVYNAKNIPAWHEIHLKKVLEAQFKCPVHINNDANCYVLGEKYFGKGREYNNIVGLILGTGMGAGLIIDGKLIPGSSCGAGEFGKIPYKEGSFESYCSEIFFDDQYGKPFEEILNRAQSGDEEAKQIFNVFGRHVGAAILTIMYTVDPDLVIIGGSIRKAFKFFFDAMWQTVSASPYKQALNKLKVDVNEEPNIGILGAAYLFHSSQSNGTPLDVDNLADSSENPVDESQNKYFKLFNRIADPVLIYDKKTHSYLGCNRAVEKVYGYTPQEIKSLTPFDLHDPKDHRKLEKSINIKNKNFPFHFNHITKSGKKLEVEVISDEIMYENRKSMISIVRDITDRKRVEDELRRSKSHLEEAKKQTDNILRHVEEGIFLLGSDYKIKSQYSAELESIFFRNSLGNKKFLDILENKVPNDTLGLTAEFLELMFNNEFEQNMIRELNPLSRVEVHLDGSGSEEKQLKHLDFNFQRILNRAGKINELMVTVIDNTDQVLLAEKLKRSEAKTKNQLEIVLVLLRVDPVMLTEFIDSASVELEKMEELLSELKQEGKNEKILEEVFRSAHLIKGNAGLLDLTIFAEEAHAFEHIIDHLRNKTIIAESDVRNIQVKLLEIKQNYQEVISLIDKIGRIHAQFRPKRKYENKLFIDSLRRFIRQNSRELENNVELVEKNFDFNAIPHGYKTTVKEILIQLIRNSIAHGIESSEERIQKGKDPAGIIELSTKMDKDKLQIWIKDDGRGLQIDRLRDRAISLGKWDKDIISKWTDEEITETIFISGISTAGNTSMLSGRGVGMDIVKEKITQLDGEISVSFKPERSCQFIITLPLNN